MNQTQTRPCHSSSKRPPRPKPKGNGQPIRTRGPLANGRTVEGAPRTERAFFCFLRAHQRGPGLPCALALCNCSTAEARTSSSLSSFTIVTLLPPSNAFLPVLLPALLRRPPRTARGRPMPRAFAAFSVRSHPKSRRRRSAPKQKAWGRCCIIGVQLCHSARREHDARALEVSVVRAARALEDPL